MKTIGTSICFIILSTFACVGAEFDLGTHGIVSVAVPDGWTVKGEPSNRPGEKAPGYTLSFTPAEDVNAKCLLTFLFVTSRPPDQAGIRGEVLRNCEQFVSESVEKKKNLKDFSLERGYGAYCVFTDASLVGKKAKPGQYKVMGSGQLQPSEDMVGVVSLFADDAESEEFTAMVSIINSLKVTPKDRREPTS